MKSLPLSMGCGKMKKNKRSHIISYGTAADEKINFNMRFQSPAVRENIS